MIKKIAFLAFAFINTCSAAQLTSYQDTVDAINNGMNIKYVVDWDLCKTNVPNVIPNFSSSYNLGNINIDKSGFISSWGSTFVHEIKRIPQLGAVTQAFVYTFTKDNSLHVINRYLDPLTYKEKIPAMEADCDLNNGFKVFSF